MYEGALIAQKKWSIKKKTYTTLSFSNEGFNPSKDITKVILVTNFGENSTSTPIQQKPVIILKWVGVNVISPK